MALYNVFSNTGRWDHDSLGYIATIECENVLEGLESFVTVTGAETRDLPFCIEPVLDFERLADEHELNYYFEGAPDHCAIIPGLRGERPDVFVAVELNMKKGG